MYKKNKTKDLQQKLIQKGYIGLFLRHTYSYGDIWEYLYLLVKDPSLPKNEWDFDVEYDSSESDFIDINSDEALRIIENYIFRNEINPDPFEL